MNYMVVWEGTKENKFYRASGDYFAETEKITKNSVIALMEEIKDYYDLDSLPSILNIIKLEDEE